MLAFVRFYMALLFFSTLSDAVIPSSTKQQNIKLSSHIELNKPNKENLKQIG